MGCLTKLIDAILFLFFLVIALAAPLIDGQTVLPLDYYPPFFIDLKQRYASEVGDYLVSEKPHFFVGLVWLELLFQWPLAVANLFGILGTKPWVPTTCLIYGASVVTSMAAIVAEMNGSGRASEKFTMAYYPFMGLGVLALLRGLMGECGKTTTMTLGKRPALARKKRA